MPFLRALFGFVEIRLLREDLGSVPISDVLANLGDRLIGDARRVGSHVRDEADVSEVTELFAFVELLRDGHRLLDRILEAAVGLLLKLRSRERRAGRLFLLLAGDLFDDIRASLQR